MISPRLAGRVVHPLLNDDPLSIVGNDEPMQVEIKPVLDGCTVDLRHQTADICEPKPIDAHAITYIDQNKG